MTLRGKRIVAKAQAMRSTVQTAISNDAHEPFSRIEKPTTSSFAASRASEPTSRLDESIQPTTSSYATSHAAESASPPEKSTTSRTATSHAAGSASPPKKPTNSRTAASHAAKQASFLENLSQPTTSSIAVSERSVVEVPTKVFVTCRAKGLPATVTMELAKSPRPKWRKKQDDDPNYVLGIPLPRRNNIPRQPSHRKRVIFVS